MFVSDFGHDIYQKCVADNISSQVKSKIKFICGLGDNIYEWC